MNANDIIEFLLPSFYDGIQLIFAIIILVMVLGTIIWVSKDARPENWERKWNRDTQSNHDDISIEHGSVTDLSNAVATVPEKLAEVMPGLLLVVGLLGTFLGLGIALNHASNILGGSNALSADNIGQGMQDLLAMLQGLGTKFKTSTWGILGYIVLKIWGEATRFEEKRLGWVIEKVSESLHNQKDKELKEIRQQREFLFSIVNKSLDRVVEGFSNQTIQLIQTQKTLHDESFQQFAQISEKSADSIAKSFADQTNQLTESQKLFHEQSLKQFIQISEKTRESSEILQKFSQGMTQLVEKLSISAGEMAEGAGKVGNSADELMGSVNAFSYQFKDVLDSVRTDLSEVLNNVRSDLTTAITDMSSQASQTLERGSQKMETATRDISIALDKLSGDVRETMSEVQSSIQNALEIQQRSAAEFTLSSQTLNESLTVSTSIVENLGQPIREGLESVANAGQHMRSVGKKLDESLKSFEFIGQLAQMLAPLKEVVNQNTAVLAALKPLYSLIEQHKTLKEIQSLLTASVRYNSLPRDNDIRNSSDFISNKSDEVIRS